MVFYDCHGTPVAYTEDGIHVFLFTGEPAAYFEQDAVYGYNGKQLGWFNNGWIRDLQGLCVFFSENASGSGPVKPIKRICPIKSIKQIKPIKSIREIRRIRPINQLAWSPLSGKQFFAQ